MMRGTCGAVAVAVAALLVCCSADPHQEQDGGMSGNSLDRFDTSVHKARNLDPLGGGHLIREVRQLSRYPYSPYVVSKNEYPSQYHRGDIWPPMAALAEYKRFYAGLPKRNFDEIDRSGLNLFVNRRNFDEIDQTSMPFPYKRFSRFYRPNYIGSPAFHEGKEEKRFHDIPMDEIDLSYFPIGSRR